MEEPIAVAICSTRSGAKAAPHAVGVGKVAAFHTARPVRHSSWTSAGTPSRVSVTRRRCRSRSQWARSTGSTGLVPYGRVR